MASPAPKGPPRPPTRNRKPLRKRLRPEVLYSFTFPTAGQRSAAGAPGELVPADKPGIRALHQRYPAELKAAKAKILRARLGSATEQCWIILDADGTPAGYCHLAYTSTVNTRINHPVHVEEGAQAYFFDDYVFKVHRGKGLHALSLLRRCEIASERGLGTGLTTITSKNTASLRSYGRLGLRRSAVLVHVPVLNRTWRVRGS